MELNVELVILELNMMERTVFAILDSLEIETSAHPVTRAAVNVLDPKLINVRLALIFRWFLRKVSVLRTPHVVWDSSLMLEVAQNVLITVLIAITSSSVPLAQLDLPLKKKHSMVNKS